MKRTRMFLMLIAASSLWHGASAQHVAEAPNAVLAQNLTQLESTGKVKAALWTLRNDSCTLQLMLPWERAARPAQGMDQAGFPRSVPTGSRSAPAGPLPAVKVWLLAANGSEISAMRVARPNPALFTERTITADFSFSFPRSANGQAVAAAIQIGDDFYIEKLATLADQPL